MGSDVQTTMVSTRLPAAEKGGVIFWEMTRIKP